MRASAIPQLQIGEIMFALANSPGSGNGRPESVFISWLLWQPRGADLATEARKEMDRLAPHAGRDANVVRLHALFSVLAGQAVKPH